MNAMRLIGLMALAIALVAGSTQADAGESTVSSTGTATLKKAPDVLRMQVELRGEGKDMTEALAKLHANEATAKKSLVELGATDASIQLKDVKDGSVKNPREQQMEYYMRQQMMQRGGKKPPTTAPVTVKVSATLLAEWPLSGTGDELMAKTWALTDKVKKADIAGAKSAPASLTPEQQEEMEEQQAMLQQAMAAEGAAGAEPQFTYVAKVSDQDQANLAAEAFKNAKAEAARLAAASGMQLDALRQISAQAIASSNAQNNEQQMYYAYAQMMSGNRANPAAAGATEATGKQPSDVEMRVIVTTTFALK